MPKLVNQICCQLVTCKVTVKTVDFTRYAKGGGDNMLNHTT